MSDNLLESLLKIREETFEERNAHTFRAEVLFHKMKDLDKAIAALSEVRENPQWTDEEIERATAKNSTPLKFNTIPPPVKEGDGDCSQARPSDEAGLVPSSSERAEQEIPEGFTKWGGPGFGLRHIDAGEAFGGGYWEAANIDGDISWADIPISNTCYAGRCDTYTVIGGKVLRINYDPVSEPARNDEGNATPSDGATSSEQSQYSDEHERVD